jgi:hypothetical protein
MALNKDRISSLQGQINSLEVQKWMKNTVKTIQKDIFSLFANTEITTADKQKVVGLESALFSRITSLEQDTSPEIQEVVKKIKKQKEFLTKIKNSIDQVNTPKSIEKSLIVPEQKNIQLLQSNIVTDYNGISVHISNLGKCIINNKSSTIKINSVNQNNGTHRQLEYQDKIFWRIQKWWDGWMFIPNPHIESIGITNIQIPFVVQKDIAVADPDTGKKFISIVTKKKPWIIDTKQWIANANSTENTNWSNTKQNNHNNISDTQPLSGNNEQSRWETIDIDHEEIIESNPESSNTDNPPEMNIANPGMPSKAKENLEIEDIKYEDIADENTSKDNDSSTPASAQTNNKKLAAWPKQLQLPPHTWSDAIEKIDMTMEQLMQIVKLTDMRNHYNHLASRRQTLKKHMQDFDKDGSINADTPLFRSIFPALEHEINEFKKWLTNAIIDTKEKIDLIQNSGITDLDAVKQLAQQVRDIQTAYTTINNDFAIVHKDLLDRIYKKTPKQITAHIDNNTNTGLEDPVEENNNSAFISSPNPNNYREEYASISNVTNISRQEAERQAEEIMRERIQNMAWYNPDRIRHFAMRSFIKQAEIEKIINKKQWFHREDDKTKATERHQLQYETDMDDIDMVELIDETTYPRAYQQINTLVAQYVDTPHFASTMTDWQFEQKFQAIIMARPSLDNRQPSLRDLMKQNNMDQVSSNILYRSKMFKDHQILVDKISNEIANTITQTQFANRCRPLIMNYVSKYNKIPDFMKLQHINLNLDDAQLYNKLRRYGAHQYGLKTIAAQSLRLKVKILNKGRAAHEITDQDHGIITKAGKFWDGDWIANSERLKKHPKLKETLGWLRWGTKIAWTVGMVIGVWAITNPLVAGLAMGGTVWLRTLISKFSHYTKEYEWQLRNHAIDSINYNAEQDRLHDMVENGELQRWHKYLPTKKWQERRHRERYINTTQSNILLSKDIATTIRRYTTNANPLTQIEIDQLRATAGDALARLDYYRSVGQNFTGTDQYTQAEKDYHDLYQTVLWSLERLSTNLATLRQDPAYTTSHDIIEQQYQETFRNFKSKRRKLGRHRAIARWLLTGWLTYASKLTQAATTKVTTTTNEKEILSGSNERELAKHSNTETMAGSTIDASFPVVSNPTTIPANSDIWVVIDVWTDATRVINPAKYATELVDYQSRLSAMTGSLHPDTAAEIQQMIDGTHSSFNFIDGAWWADSGNALLAKCRYLRGVEEYLQDLNTNPNVSSIHASFQTTASAPGASIDNAVERFFNVKSYLIETTEHTSQWRWGYGIPGNISDNTFKRREGNVWAGYMTNNPNRPQIRPQNP